MDEKFIIPSLLIGGFVLKFYLERLVNKTTKPLNEVLDVVESGVGRIISTVGEASKKTIGTVESTIQQTGEITSEGYKDISHSVTKGIKNVVKASTSGVSTATDTIKEAITLPVQQISLIEPISDFTFEDLQYAFNPIYAYTPEFRETFKL